MDARAVVLVADTVRSRSVAAFAKERDRRLKAVSTRHQRRGWIAAPYAVTAWDEFQTVLAHAASIPHVVWDLRLAFQPMSLRIGLGQGAIASMPLRGQPVNVGGSGKAFQFARLALDSLKGRTRLKYPVLTALRSDNEDLESVVNCIFALQDSLLQRITRRQWETITKVERVTAQDKAARSLGVDESTVSRNLKRGSYWQIKDAGRVLERLLTTGESSGRLGTSSPTCTLESR
jgi:hypothetical protein